MFKSVHAIQLPINCNSLTIERQGDQFLLSGRDWSGSITAGACYQAEDDCEYFDPSPFEESFGG